MTTDVNSMTTDVRFNDNWCNILWQLM